MTDNLIDNHTTITLGVNEVTFSRELYNFNQQDLLILKELCKSKEPFKSIELVRRTGIHEGGVNRVLKRLMKKGFVKRISKTHEWEFLGRETLENVLKARVERLIENIFNE